MALIAQYLFESDILDETANNNDGTINGGGTEIYVAGVDGQGFRFNNLTDISIGDTPFDFERTDTFSIAAWIKTNTDNVDDFIFGKISGQQGYQMHLRTTNNEIRFKLANSNSNRILMDTVGVNVRDGKWHHIVMTYDGSSAASGVTIYVDGDAVTTSTVADTLTLTTLHNTEFVIGNQEHLVSSKFFTGRMDYFEIYDNELTSVEVTDLFVNEGLPINTVKLSSVSALPSTVLEGIMIRVKGKVFIGNDGVWQRL